MRMPRLLTRRPRPLALLAGGLATATFGTLATFGSVYDGQNAGATLGTPGCSVGIEWRGDPGFFGSCTGTDPDVPDECKGAGTATDLCVTVTSRPAYGWINPGGSRTENPDGRAQVRDLDETPGTPEFMAALRALDAEWREHH
ncbi:hypothetical protein Z951_02770 [Streptomyces sp. PRh5]|nr:hypothetical protein Z951_02770 [Streptomyces sp. PRh5]